MPKTKQVPSLDLDGSQTVTSVGNRVPPSPSTMSPTSPISPKSPREATIRPVTARGKSSSEYTNGGENQQTIVKSPTSPTMTAIPQFPPSPRSPPKHGRDTSKSFFSNLMASKSSHRVNSPERSTERSGEKDSRSRTSSKERTLYSRHTRGSTTDLSKMNTVPDMTNDSETQEEDLETQSFVQQTPESASSNPSSSSRNRKQKFGGILQRTRSIRADDPQPKSSKTTAPQRLNLQRQDSGKNSEFQEPLRTAPPKPAARAERDRSFKDAVNSTGRTRSADRHESESNEKLMAPRQREKSNLSTSLREGAGAQLLSNLSQTSRGAADRLGKAGKGFFGKITRSGSGSNEREVANDDNYHCRVITLPLIQQTRRTRIARRLELSKDKTEFWMPALPWRCIDYLNMNGCEEEGLYRIPGSGREVKHWQRRFDIERDINLFEETELYDINIIGSMFKAWLRDLPDEILPKAVQNRVAEKCMGATATPQLFKDELSRLPPFNYYLLFAITCHLSLLHSFSDKNKMTYHNLCICFQPCLKIDSFCFQFLVTDWKNCWQGCWTEREFLEEEYRWEKESDHAIDTQSADERVISSSDSSHIQVQQSHVDMSSRTASPAPSQPTNAIDRNQRHDERAMSASQTQQLLPEVKIGAPLSPIKIP